MTESYYSHGKLLLSGEYLVLDGATALALPTRPGQWLRVSSSADSGLRWISKNPDGSVWFETYFEKEAFHNPGNPEGLPSDIRGRLLFILTAALKLNPGFREKLQGARVETLLEFPREWGLGSSSTLISNLGLWAEVNPYALLANTMGGSGYDIASARSEGPLFYTLNPQKGPEITPAPFYPTYADQLFFVYLNQKQDSREGIARYRDRGAPPEQLLRDVSSLSRAIPEAGSLDAFREIIEAHETLIAEILGMETVKRKWFREYPGSIKSLGAWGGDFILATGTPQDQEYFREKGYAVIRPYSEFIL